MPTTQKNLKAVWTPKPVPDYPEAYHETLARIEYAGLTRRAERYWKTAQKHRRLTNEASRGENGPRHIWLRMHFPPELPPPISASSAECTTSIADESPSASIDEVTPSRLPPSSNTAESSLLPPSSSLASAEPGESIDSLSPPPTEPPADAPLEWSATQIPPDNSCPIAPTDETIDPETFLRRILADALWAMDNAMHVKAGRKKIRDNPRTAAAWLHVNSALSDPRQFLTAVITRCETALKDHDARLAKIKADEIAAAERAEAKREEKRKARVNANGNIHELFDRLRSRLGESRTTLLAGAKGPRSQS